MSPGTSLKPEVKVGGLQPELVLGLLVARDVYAGHGFPLVITAVRDGKHKEGSLHYTGFAADLRAPSRYLAGDTNINKTVAAEVKAALGPDYDVVVEGDDTPGATAAHIHLEYDPK